MCVVITGTSDRLDLWTTDLIYHDSSLCGNGSHGLTTTFQDSDASLTKNVRNVRKRGDLWSIVRTSRVRRGVGVGL